MRKIEQLKEESVARREDDELCKKMAFATMIFDSVYLTECFDRVLNRVFQQGVWTEVLTECIVTSDMLVHNESAGTVVSESTDEGGDYKDEPLT